MEGRAEARGAVGVVRLGGVCRVVLPRRGSRHVGIPATATLDGSLAPGHLGRTGRLRGVDGLGKRQVEHVVEREGHTLGRGVSRVVGGGLRQASGKHAVGGRVAEHALARTPGAEARMGLGVDAEELERAAAVGGLGGGTLLDREARGSSRANARPAIGTALARGRVLDPGATVVHLDRPIGRKRHVDRSNQTRRRTAEVEPLLARARAVGKEGVADVVGHRGRERLVLLLRDVHGKDHALLGARKRDVEQPAVLARLGLGALGLHEGAPLERGGAVLGARRRVLAQVGQGKAGRCQRQDHALAVPAREQTRSRARALGAAAANHGHHVELEALGGVRGHEAHRVEALARERRRPLLGRVEPAAELVRRPNGIECRRLGELADVADCGKHVGRDGTAGDALSLQAREPARLAHGHEADVGHGQRAHARPGTAQHATGGHEALGGAHVPKEGLALARTHVDAALGRGVEHLLGLGGQKQHVVRVEGKHAAREQREHAGLGVLRVGERAQQGQHGAHLGRLREGGAAHHDALEAAGTKRGDVGVRVVQAAHEHGHAPGLHPSLADARQAVGQLACGDAATLGLGDRTGPQLVGARELHHHARGAALRKVALAVRLGLEVHERRDDAGGAADARHEAQDGVVAPEVVVEPHRAGLAHLGAAVLEHAHVGAAEAIDGLLGVTHRGEVAGPGAGEPLDHADLLPVGVLELVDHDEAELRRVLVGELGVLAEGPGEQLEQIVVVEHAPGALLLGVEGVDPPREAHERLLQRLGPRERHLARGDAKGLLGLGAELLHGLGAPLVAVGPVEPLEHFGRELGRAPSRRELAVRAQASERLAAALELVGILGVAATQGLVGLGKRRHDVGHVDARVRKRKRVEPTHGRGRLVAHRRHEAQHALAPPKGARARRVLGEEGVQARVPVELG